MQADNTTGVPSDWLTGCIRKDGSSIQTSYSVEGDIQCRRPLQTLRILAVFINFRE
jgi:hypothetical protein